MMTMTDIQKYADKAMYPAEPIRGEGPGVYLLWMTPDPLGAIAAACRMYEGKPTYSMADVTPEERIHYFEETFKTHLKAPLEFVKFHFFIEGVDRAFTHQMVRQRSAVYAQESLRFAVKEGFASETVKPPSIVEVGGSMEEFFDATIKDIESAYSFMIANGIPAEDARAILPHCVATRLNYCTDLRSLAEHAGNRLCTQAQFLWRAVFAQIVSAIRQHSPMIANSELFRPVCYQIGHCPFKANFDRGCTIRDRVDANAALGRESKLWGDEHMGPGGRPDVYPIYHQEWLLDSKAGWLK